MASTKIIVPDFEWMNGLYYADILRSVRTFNRVNAPEITSEVAEEPFIQLERAFALVGHLCSVLADAVAQEGLVPTAKLRDSLAVLFRLIDYQLADYSPATAELLIKLPQALTTSTQILEDNSLFETRRVEDEDPIPFEVDSLTIGPTDVPDSAFFERRTDSVTGRGGDPVTGSDLLVVTGESDVVESATANWTSADLKRLLVVTGSTLGNNRVYQIGEIVSTLQVRLAPVFGQSSVNLVSESSLSWEVRNYEADVTSDLTVASTPVTNGWGSAPVAGDKFYLGSSYVMWSEMDVVVDSAYSGISGLWEYYDPDLDNETPDAVSNQGSFLRFTVTTLLGAAEASGAMVTVTHLSSGVSETIPSTFVGGLNVVDTSSFLGQTGTPSTDAEDYSVSSIWVPLQDQTDGSSNLSKDGKVSYTLPQTTRRAWNQVEVNDVTGFFLRYRIVDPGTPSVGAIDTIDISGGDQYVLPTATQGETVTNEPLASSNGQADQTFVLSQTPVLRDSVRMFVDEGGGEVEWTNITVQNLRLVLSQSKDRHFTVEVDALGEATVTVGDGTRGKIPTIGVDNIRFEYRVNASDDGNVGADTIVVNSGGSSFVRTVTNPRSAVGWKEAEGASESSLALAKENGPASLSTLGRAVTPSDYVTKALAFETAEGTSPVVRALAIEEGFGPKTLKLVVVGTDGVSIPGDAREKLEELFNGDDEVGTEGIGAANNEVTVTNFTPRKIGLTVTIVANASLTEAAVRTALTTLLSPTATDSTGGFVWSFGGRVAMSRVACDVFQTSPGNVFDVDVAEADVQLGDEELPLLDNSATTISIVAPS